MFITYTMNKEEQMKIVSLMPADIVPGADENLVVGASYNGDLCGVAICEYDKWERLYDIRTILIKDRYKGFGIESCLIDRLLLSIPKPSEIVYSVVSTKENMDTITAFKNHKDFITYYDNTAYVISHEERIESEEYLKILEMPCKADLFFDCQEYIQNKFITRMREKGIVYFSEFVKRIPLMCKDLCYAYIRNNEIKSALFAETCGNGKIELAYVYADNDVKAFFNVLCMSMKALEKNYPEYELCFIAVNEASENIAEKLFPDTFSTYPMFHAVHEEIGL